MPITVTLVDSTPYRLVYRLLATAITSSQVLPNAAGATPDLRTDALAAVARGTPNGLPLLELLRTAITTTSQARVLLLGGDNPFPALAVNRALRCRTELVSARVSAVESDLIWGVDAQVSGGGFPELLLGVNGTIGGEDDFAYLSVHLAHPKYQGTQIGDQVSPTT